MAEPTFARSRSAARRSSSATPAARTRRPAPRAAATPQPNAVPDEVAVRLALALAELDDVRPTVAGYRAEAFTDEEWAAVGNLVRLGIAAHAPSTRRAAQTLGWALGVHARIQLVLGTSRTITAWYGPDALNTSLAGGRVGRGPDAFTPPARFASSFNARLRTVGRTLVKASPPPPRKFGAYDPQAPLSTAELEEVLDFCDAHRGYRGPGVGQRLARLVWLGVGTGVKNADLVHVGEHGPEHLPGTAVERTEHAVVLNTAGPTPRRIPVLGSCEAAVLDAAAAAGEGPLLARLRRTNIADEVVAATGWRRGDRFPPTAGRLRQTWLATVLAADVPYTGMLRAAGISGERTLAAVAVRLPVLDEAAYERALRCTGGPLPVAGQLLLPGERHLVPHVPLREQP